VVAHIHLMSQIGARVTLLELAARMTRAHGKRSFTQGQMSEYQKGITSPSLEVVWAYAKATGVDPGWLAFGSETSAPAPSGFSGVPDMPLPRKRPTKKRG
jgi:transcriptional regulator with XRE-family HTH domain